MAQFRISKRHVLCAHGNGDVDRKFPDIDLSQYTRNGHSVKIIFEANRGEKCYVNLEKTNKILDIMRKSPESEIYSNLIGFVSDKRRSQCIIRREGNNTFNNTNYTKCPNYMITMENNADLIKRYGWGIWTTENKGVDPFAPGSTFSLKDYIDFYLSDYDKIGIDFVGYFTICRGSNKMSRPSKPEPDVVVVDNQNVQTQEYVDCSTQESNDNFHNRPNGETGPNQKRPRRGGSRRKRKRRTKSLKNLKN